MKLLFDENISPKLPQLLETLFPDSMHVRDCGLRGLPDDEIWEYARSHHLTIVSKDSDFQQRSLLFGSPPKIVWLRIGNCTTEQIARLITAHRREIESLVADPFESILLLS